MEEQMEKEPYVVVADVQESAKMTKRAKRKADKRALKSAKKQKKLEKKQVKKEAKSKKRRWRLGDRADGYLIRGLTPYARITPYIMQIRSDSQNLFEEEIDITDIEDYIRAKKKEGYINFGMLHIIIAAFVRAASQRPGINRFIAGNKIYARKNIEVVMVVKKKMSTSAPDTTMKCVFEPTDTVIDIYNKWNTIVEEIHASALVEKESAFDKLARVLNYIPGILLKWTVSLLRFLDWLGLLPRFLTKLSPFHGSMIITSMGSLGIGPIYHHLYNFGNLPVFLSYGKMYSKIVVGEDGTPLKRHFIGFRAVTDERICDGYYYASAFKAVLFSIKHPATLEVPPEKVVEDIR